MKIRRSPVPEDGDESVVVWLKDDEEIAVDVQLDPGWSTGTTISPSRARALANELRGYANIVDGRVRDEGLPDSPLHAVLERACTRSGATSLSMARSNAERRVQNARSDVETHLMNADGALMYWLLDACLAVLENPMIADDSRIYILGEVVGATLAEMWKDPLFSKALNGVARDVLESRKHLPVQNVVRGPEGEQ